MQSSMTTIRSLAALVAGLLVPIMAAAQQPTQAQLQAVKGSCRSDYTALCRSVPTGGAASLQCLAQHRGELSAACGAAVDAITGKPPAPKPAAAAPAPQAPAGAQAVPPPRPAAAAADWPHTVNVGDAVVTVYQPQAIAWPGKTELNARTAISVAPPGKPPVLGTLDFTAATRADFTTRTVQLSDFRLTASRFPSLDTEQAGRFDARAKEFLAALPPRAVPLDTVLLGLKDSGEAPRAVATDNTPPTIFVSARPASLVVFDGEPVMAPVGGTHLTYAVNTNWDVLYDADTAVWFLLNNGAWYSAPAATGPWAPAAALPPSFNAIPGDANFADIRRHVPGLKVAPNAAATIFVSTTPAEIIVTAGPPAFTPVPGTALQRVSNTGATLFRDTSNGKFYFLTSGRWFSAATLDGPWTFATPDLPADFARIPPDGADAAVLASVPGTAQAQQAVMEAQVPRQATLRRDAAAPEIAYVGAPEFKPIPGTNMQYAVNTTSQVLQVGGLYYACVNGAWFTAPSPTGPWTLAEAVPPEVYAIPPSSPLYNVTYVKVYGATPEAVTYGYTAGYLMGYVTAGVVVYGTGYYYPPVVVPGPVPAYLPYPYSYAGGVYYNPATGVWGRGGTVYGPYGGAATAGGVYNPATGAYAHGAAVYGPYGGAGAWSAYNPATGTYAHGSAAWSNGSGTANASFSNPRYGVSGSTTQNVNPYGRWGSSTVSTPSQTINTRSGSNASGSAGAFSSSTGAVGAGVHGAGGNSAGVVKGGGGNVYAGADGNVYRHTSSGWSSWNNGSWQPVQPPTNAAAGNRAAPASQPNTLGAQQPAGAGTQRPNAPAAQQPAAQPRQPAASQPRQPAARQASAASSRPTLQGQQYQQLEQDRFAREQGAARQQRFGGAGAAAGGFHRRFGR